MFNFNSTEKDQKITALKERIKTLESQNAIIIQEMQNMCYNYNQHIDRLEKRITDFTDIWNPFMTANMVRIKDELVAETQKNSQEYIDQNINKLLPSQSEKKQENTMDPMSGYIVIGTRYNDSVGALRNLSEFSPVILEKNASYDKLLIAMQKCSRHFIVDSIAAFSKTIKHFDLDDLVCKDSKQICPTIMIDIDGNDICSSPMWGGKIEYSRVEKLDKAFAKYGVELLYKGKPIKFNT